VLRALARASGEWCATHFITDPEASLGSGTEYLLAGERGSAARTAPA
jgi:hypothetical protein